MPDHPPPSPGRIALRASVLVLVGAWLVLGPLFRGVLEMKSLKWVPRWTMFGGWGRDICEARYYRVSEGSKPKRVSWAKTLGRSTQWGKGVKHQIHTPEQALVIGREMCNVLDEPGLDLRAKVRCGSKTTWKRKEWMDQNLCLLEVQYDDR